MRIIGIYPICCRIDYINLDYITTSDPYPFHLMVKNVLYGSVLNTGPK